MLQGLRYRVNQMINLTVKLRQDNDYDTFYTNKNGVCLNIHSGVPNKERAIRAILEYIQINNIEYDELVLTVINK